MPTTTGKATELITFSRGTLATVTDSDGKIKWAPHNLLTNSESFDASAWTKTALTVTANNVVAPNGTTTADKLIPSATSNYHNAYQGATTSGVGYSVSVYAKAAGYNFLYVANSGTTASAIFNLSTGAVSSTGAGATSAITPLADGWYLCSITFTSTSANAIEFGVSSTSTWGVFTGDGTSGIHLWGAHLYRSDLGGMQANTSAYPMYNPTTPKNMLGYSEDFSNAAWVAAKSGTAALGVKTPNYGIAPDGTLRATRIQLDVSAGSASNQSQVYQQFSSVNGGVYTRSAWIKTNDGSTKTIMGFQAGGATPNTITVTGEWTRYSAVRTADGTADFLQLLLIKGTTSDTADLLVWRPQVSDSASLDAYSPVFGAAPSAAAYHGPRLDFDPVTLSARGLLVEEARTNLLLHTAAFDNAAWSKYEVNTTGTPAWVNVGTAPDGTATAEKIIETTVNDAHIIYRTETLTAAAYTFSVYAKAAERSILYLRLDNGGAKYAYFNLSTGAASNVNAAYTAAITPVGNGWYRCAITATGTAASYTPVIGVTTTAGTPVYAGDGTSGVLIWGAQLEAGSFATSYIPTAAATVTRNADVASVGVSQFPYSATEGTIVVNGSWNGSNDNYAVFSSFYVDVNNHLTLDANNTARSVQLNNRVAGTFTVGISGLNTGSSGVPFKAGAAYKENDFAAVVNGGTVGTDTAATPVSGVSVLYLGARGGNAQFLSGHIRQITYLPRRISNAELQTRTA